MNIQSISTLSANPLIRTKSNKVNHSAFTDALRPVTKKAKSADFSMVMLDKQKNELYEKLDHTKLGYDNPQPKQQKALNEYFKVSAQQKRDQIIESMSFHYVV
jgi:hypothetical protein